MDYIKQLSEQSSKYVKELFPWDYYEHYEADPEVLFVDVREPYEYAVGHAQKAINVPRGILETAATFGYEDTVPELAEAKEKTVIVACRSGKRSLWAAYTLQMLGFQNVLSLKTGMRGWNDYELPPIRSKVATSKYQYC